MSATVAEALLQASSLQYFVRALMINAAPEIELSIIRIINDLTDTDGGVILFGGSLRQLLQLTLSREVAGLDNLVERACMEGIVYEGGITAGPLTQGARLEGVIALFGPDCGELLGSVIALLTSAMQQGREVVSLRTENAVLHSQIDETRSGILGNSPAMQQLRLMIGKVAPRDATVLVLGESGTGKELIAHAVHEQSPRARRRSWRSIAPRFAETLLESELFGHERGAFTGAVTQKKGKLEVAEGGTVFLDEIGELAAESAGQAAADIAGAHVRARGRHANDALEHPGGGGHQPRPGD